MEIPDIRNHRKSTHDNSNVRLKIILRNFDFLFKNLTHPAMASLWRKIKGQKMSMRVKRMLLHAFEVARILTTQLL